MFKLFKSDKANVYEELWKRWKIKSYRISLKVNWEFLNFDREILSDIISIKVDGYHGHFLQDYTTYPYVHEEDNWSVDGLFEQLDFYPTVQYDNVYGFPKKLGNAGDWVIEVIKFEILEYEEDETLEERFEDIIYAFKWSFRKLRHNIQWHYLSLKFYLLGKRQTITLKDYLMTGSFGGIQIDTEQEKVIEILGGLNGESKEFKLWGIHSLEVGFGEYDEGLKTNFIKYNCHGFYQDKRFPPAIHIKGFLPEYKDTTLEEFIFHLESEHIPYEIKWEELMNIRFPRVYVNEMTQVTFAEDTLAILGIYPNT